MLLVVDGFELADVVFQVGHHFPQALGLSLEKFTNDTSGFGVVEDRPDDVGVKLTARFLVSLELAFDALQLHFLIPVQLIGITRLIELHEARNRQEANGTWGGAC